MQTAPTSSAEKAQRQQSSPVPMGRTFLGGVLMGLANLVPGISGGTMILAVGLYDRFIGAVADVTRLRLGRDTLQLLCVLACGVAVALLSLSGLAVGLVNDHRWVMYSVFVGHSLGGVPDLARRCRPFSWGVGAACSAGLAGMAALAWGLAGTQLGTGVPVLLVVGAFAASSMILPGVSGSYVLLILGMYDTVIGSLSVGAMREDLRGCLVVLVPIVVGGLLGIALLSNLLKWLLARHSSVSHGALLGLLCGSVFGLFPFQEPLHPDLADKRLRKATAALIAGQEYAGVRAEHGQDLSDEELSVLAEAYAGKTPGELKAMGEQLKYFTPGAGQVGAALGLLLLGFMTTRLLGRRTRD